MSLALRKKALTVILLLCTGPIRPQLADAIHCIIQGLFAKGFGAPAYTLKAKGS